MLNRQGAKATRPGSPIQGNTQGFRPHQELGFAFPSPSHCTLPDPANGHEGHEGHIDTRDFLVLDCAWLEA